MLSRALHTVGFHFDQMLLACAQWDVPRNNFPGADCLFLPCYPGLKPGVNQIQPWKGLCPTEYK